ncbi:MAG: hypothetical protein A2600_10090 [Candidatus Lambdaproteobacteria bacterium RIFOXYD1_FULL_56_27]|uniref:Organic solvent tolerance-like N-terminal domain-containing protein n=1 Tax=Candidatus Lambdaproteobacteria bacterium RIFOXYD2_FULL_56_26 TaxID=1817773 RepID=A0A1F6H1T5_9PROT|nr:MAG: hypothetical protein A2426_12370 [Candidatus Lambdaproteobacteria bacterium RIFOXYC1_FULL_56_13]OGH04357.1 MAG: hypothetical protein A2557_10950 [Candidatus Lambdaproteobacteria bacterium RIFOXYD2_FULL_56_26]OGH08668.1 MAG: hypothetical protein A2600_10090 [Candidatus Lambdaproteobacteria bacterium RIFOXYD1_FULL_56_27]
MKLWPLWLGLLCCVPLTALEAQEKAQLKGQSMVVNQKKRSLVIERQVVAHQPLRDIHLKADRLELLRDASTDEVNYLAIDGKSEVTQKDQFAQFDHGVYERRLGLATLTGHLVAGNQEMKIEGHQLRYDLNQKTGSITALPGEKVRFWFNRQAPNDPAQAHPVEGQASEVLVYESLKKMVLQGSVEVVDQFDQSKVKAERMVVFLDSTNQLDELTASGGVDMAQPGRVSSSDRAVLDYGPQLITLLGNAKVTQTGEGDVEGEKIEMHMDVKQGFLTGKRSTPLRMEIPLK